MDDSAAEIGRLAGQAREAEREMQRLRRSAETFATTFAGTMKEAVRSGADFDDMLRRMGARFSDMALDQALRPLEDLMAGVLGRVGADLPAGGAPSAMPPSTAAGRPVQLNVNALDAGSFMKSQTQIAAARARAVRMGARNL